MYDDYCDCITPDDIFQMRAEDKYAHYRGKFSMAYCKKLVRQEEPWISDDEWNETHPRNPTWSFNWSF